MTLEQYYEVYKRTCYGPAPLHPIQNKEIKQAFTAGALIIFELMERLTEKPELEAFEAMDNLKEECRKMGELLVSKTGKNN